MLNKITLEGHWNCQLDAHKIGLQKPFTDTMKLPGTTSHEQKGTKNDEVKINALTDEYAFEGFAWFEREVEVPDHLAGQYCLLYLERTRVTTVCIDGVEIGSQNSLNTAHVYDLSGTLGAGRHTITIRVDNSNYPTKGGHLTSEDTQTNWNGITGRMELQFFGSSYLQNIQVYPDAVARVATIQADVIGEVDQLELVVSAVSYSSTDDHVISQQVFQVSEGSLSVNYEFGEKARLWSDLEPNLYQLNITLQDRNGELLDNDTVIVGLRDFKANGDKFTINGKNTFLRGKHDGLIFPLTGYAPTDVEEWVRILSISKSYGINHYRFHTCCPPDAAFTAADIVGIYMEPELPFWGTITDENDENHNQAEQEYLISEGFAMLHAFGNHPSFVMMSLGNELWGSKSRLNDILKSYKAYDSRHLYTQGSNNFQFVPEILDEEEFYCGVRFSRDRLFRGSYAMCDAPLGHVQTDQPSTMKDYDEQIRPSMSSHSSSMAETDQLIEIQYGTGTKTVQAEATDAELIPHIPVVSHEIGQYATFPNFNEINKYTGSLKAKNFEVFRERLEAKGLGHLAQQYFEYSGKLAAACYKEELEAAFRSKELAGFQLLDLQDFSGQGTALVGVLDAFMDSKGMITPEEWRTFCSEAVLLARFEKYNYEAGETFQASVDLSYYGLNSLEGHQVKWSLAAAADVLAEGEMTIPAYNGANYIEIDSIALQLPAVDKMIPVRLNLTIIGTDIRKSYDLWIYPPQVELDWSGIHVLQEFNEEAIQLLEHGEDIMLLPDPASLSQSIEGCYSTDFWCYPMFRSISESMNKPTPIGTMGLLIQKEHAIFDHFNTESYSTYPWWSTVTHSRSLILDDAEPKIEPLVQTIDNFERNHRLGLLFECRVLNGRVLIGAMDVNKVIMTPEGRQLFHSILQYVRGMDYMPEASLTLSELEGILQRNR